MGRIPVLSAALLLAMSAIAHGQSQGPAKPAPGQAAPQKAPGEAKPAPGKGQPNPAAKGETAKEAPNPAPPHVVKQKEQVDSLLGKEVYSADGQQMGLVTNVLIDSAGHPVALVIDFGGFLGVGSRKIAVDWHLMEFHPGDKEKAVVLRLTKDQLHSAPQYSPDKATSEVIFAPAPAPLPAKPATAAAAAKPHAATPGTR